MQEGLQGSAAGICGKGRRGDGGMPQAWLTPQTGLSRVGEARPLCLHMQQSRGAQEGAMIWGEAREIPRGLTAVNNRPIAHPTVGELKLSVQKGHLGSGAQHPKTTITNNER